LERREAGLEDGDDVLDLDAADADSPIGAGADVGTGTADAIGSPAYSAARRAERLGRLAARGAPSLDAADSTDAATAPTPSAQVRGGAPARALSPAPPRTSGLPSEAAAGPSAAASTTAAAAPKSSTRATAAASAVSARGPSPVQPGSPSGTSTPPAASRPHSPHAQKMAAMQGMMTMMMAQVQALTTAVAQGLQATSVATSPPRSPQMSTAQDARARFDAANGITHVPGDTSFTATPQVRDRKPTKLSNTSNIPTAPAHTAGLKKWRRDFCRYLDANVSGIGPLVCPDLYGTVATEAFDRTAVACAVEAIRIATKDTNAAEVFDDIDDEDVDPATLMELVLDYIKRHDADSSLVLERELESIAPTATGTRVAQIGQVYKDIKSMERRYKAHGLVRGPDYFVTRARLLVAQHYPGMTFSSDRAFKTLTTLFEEYHHRAADADELERRTAADGGASGNAFPAMRTGGTKVPSVAYKLAPGEPLPEAGPNWCDECKQNVKHVRHAPWCGKCKRHHPGECRQQNSGKGGHGSGDKMDYKKGYATVNAKLAASDTATAALHAEVASFKASQEALQAKLDSSQALITKYQTSGHFQHELPGGPP